MCTHVVKATPEFGVRSKRVRHLPAVLWVTSFLPWFIQCIPHLARDCDTRAFTRTRHCAPSVSNYRHAPRLGASTSPPPTSSPSSPDALAMRARSPNPSAAASTSTQPPPPTTSPLPRPLVPSAACERAAAPGRPPSPSGPTAFAPFSIAPAAPPFARSSLADAAPTVLPCAPSPAASVGASGGGDGWGTGVWTSTIAASTDSTWSLGGPGTGSAGVAGKATLTGQQASHATAAMQAGGAASSLVVPMPRPLLFVGDAKGPGPSPNTAGAAGTADGSERPADAMHLDSEAIQRTFESARGAPVPAAVSAGLFLLRPTLHPRRLLIEGPSPHGKADAVCPGNSGRDTGNGDVNSSDGSDEGGDDVLAGNWAARSAARLRSSVPLPSRERPASASPVLRRSFAGSGALGDRDADTLAPRTGVGLTGAGGRTIIWAGASREFPIVRHHAMLEVMAGQAGGGSGGGAQSRGPQHRGSLPRERPACRAARSNVTLGRNY